MSSEDGDAHGKMHRLHESRPGSTSPDICGRSDSGSIAHNYPRYHPNLNLYRTPVELSKHSPSASTNPSKPRIWSLADMASKDDKDTTDLKQPSPAFPPGLYPSSAGKIISPLPNRMPYGPYFKPDMHMNKDLYRLNNSIPPHMRDYAFLESYQRMMESTHPFSSVISRSMEANSSPFAPLSLTTTNHNNNNNTTSNNHNHNHSGSGLNPAGVSPSASSSSSSRPENTTPLSAMPPMERSLIETNAISSP